MNRAQIALVLVVGCLAGVGGALGGWALRSSEVHVATVDLEAITSERIKAVQGRPEKEVRADAEAFAQHAEVVLEAMAKEYRVAILIRPAVVSGAPDLTSEMRRRLSQSANNQD